MLRCVPSCFTLLARVLSLCSDPYSQSSNEGRRAHQPPTSTFCMGALSAGVRNEGDQPALVAMDEVEQVGAILHAPATNKKLITCPDHPEVLIKYDKRIINGFSNLFGSRRESI